MEKLYRCEVCGMILEEGQLEDKCPKCGQPKEKYVEMSEVDAEKVIRSEYTNDLHMELINLLNQIEDVANLGIEDNLDPSCVNIFKRAKAHALLLKQYSKAEIAGHISKGKW